MALRGTIFLILAALATAPALPRARGEAAAAALSGSSGHAPAPLPVSIPLSRQSADDDPDPATPELAALDGDQPPAAAEPPPTVEDAASPKPAPAAAQDRPPPDPAAELQRLLEQHRSAITNAQLGLEARRQAAAFLVGGEMFPAKIAIIQSLLGHDDAQVRQLVATSLVAQAPSYEGGPAAEFVDPLLTMLSSDATESRTIAAQALAFYRDEMVTRKIGDLARNAAAVPARLAAIDALAPNFDRREVAEELINLLDCGVDELIRRIVAVLESATGESIGMDLPRWKKWWEAKSSLDPTEWATYRVLYYRERARVVDAELKRLREQTTTRLRDFQRELFRALPRDQREARDARLTEWLNDPLPEIRSGALSIVAVLVGDEGYRPAGTVLAGLVKLISDANVDIRLSSVRILQNIQDPSIVTAVLGRVKEETNPPVRHALLRALGTIGGPEAIDMLVAEIQPAAKDREAVTEAAAALGQLAARLETQHDFRQAIDALTLFYGLAAPSETALRSAILRGMAGIGDESFAPYFLSALDSDEPTIVRPAIRGLMAIQDASRLARLRDLAGSHADATVRTVAVEAVGRFGRDAADVDLILGRLSPTTEKSEQVRAAAWEGFVRLQSSRSVADQLAAVDRLRDLPTLKVRFLSSLEDTLVARNGGSSADLDLVRDKLATELLAAGEAAEAVDRLRDLHKSLAGKNDTRALDVGLRLIQVALEASLDGILTDVLHEVAATAGTNSESAGKIVAKVGGYLDHAAGNGERDRCTTLLTLLRSNGPNTLGPGWGEMLDAVNGRLSEPPAVPTPDKG
jgi:HEAT repeat protein